MRGLVILSEVGSAASVAKEVVAREKSLAPSLRLVSGTLSLELKRTQELERELRSGLVSDRPGISSILVGVTINRTEAILATKMAENRKNKPKQKTLFLDQFNLKSPQVVRGRSFRKVEMPTMLPNTFSRGRFMSIMDSQTASQSHSAIF